MAWEKREVYIVTIYLKDKDEEGEDLNWGCGYEEYTASSMKDAEALRDKFLNGEDEYYGNLVEDCIISDEKEIREFWITKEEISKRESDRIGKQVKANGFQPTQSLVSKIQELNHLSGPEKTIQDIYNMYTAIKNPDIQKLVTEIAEECKRQEIISKHERE